MKTLSGDVNHKDAKKRYKIKFLKNITEKDLPVLRGSGKSENRTLEVTEISKTLENLAKDFNVPVLALSQINRKVEDR